MWQFRRIRGGLTSRLKGITIYAGWSALPVLAYVGLFFALSGAEELLDASLIGEGGGLAWVALGTVIFSIVVLFVPSKAIEQSAWSGTAATELCKLNV